MGSNRYLRVLFSLCSVALLVFAQSAFSQRINTYTKTTFTGGYTSIQSSGTLLINACDDCNSTAATLPFSFKYDNVTFSSGTYINVSTNGFMQIGANAGNYCCSNNWGNSAIPNGLMINTGDNVVQTGIYYQTTGSSPNRVFTVQWTNTRAYSGNGQATDYQVKLFETANSIEFIFKDNSFALGNSFGTGLHGTTTGGFITVAHAASATATPSTQIRWSSIPDRQISVTPEYIDFALADGGSILTSTVTVRSVGTAPDPVLISNVVISTGHPDFTILTMPPASLSPGQSATFQIQWVAQGAGPRGAVLLIQSNGRDSGDQQVALTGFTRSSVIEVSTVKMFNKKRVRLGEFIDEDVIIKNTGEAPLTFTDPNDFEITLEAASMYTVVREPLDPLPPGQSDTLRIRFTPTSEGIHLANLRINNSSSNDPDVDIQLRGTGILPRLVVTPDPMLFDSVEMGMSVTKKFTIYNPGSDTLVLLRHEFSSADQDFVLTPLTGDLTKIAPEHSREVDVTFTPLQRGTRVARFHVVTNIPLTFDQPRRDTATTSMYYDITGVGVPFGNLSMDLTDAGIIDSAIIDQELCRTVVITNSGDADATLTGATFTGAGGTDYVLKGITFPYTLKAKSNVSVQVCGTPSERGSRLATFVVNATSNDKAIPLTTTVDIKGLLVCLEAAPQVAFETTMLPHNATDSIVVTVTNCGDVATTYTPSITGTDAASYTVTPATSGQIEAGGTATFTVYFTPISSGLKPATLTLASTNAGTKDVALQGTGACAILDPISPVAALPTKANESSTFTITVTNSGNLPWTPNTPTITPSNAFTYVSGADTPIPGTGGTGVLTFTFNPPSMNEFTAVVSFPSAEVCGNMLEVNVTGSATAGSVKDVRTVDGYILEQNAPNPAHGGVTSFKYTVPSSSAVRIVLADVTGKTVRELVNTNVGAGTYDVDVNTAGLASGTYLYILEAGNARLVRQMAIGK